jgi:hypothetical protein
VHFFLSPERADESFVVRLDFDGFQCNGFIDSEAILSFHEAPASKPVPKADVIEEVKSVQQIRDEWAEKFNGTWKALDNKMALSFEDGKVELRQAVSSGPQFRIVQDEGVFKVDAKTTPYKAMDITWKTGPEDQVVRHWFEFKSKDRLVVWFPREAERKAKSPMLTACVATEFTRQILEPTDPTIVAMTRLQRFAKACQEMYIKINHLHQALEQDPDITVQVQQVFVQLQYQVASQYGFTVQQVQNPPADVREGMDKVMLEQHERTNQATKAFMRLVQVRMLQVDADIDSLLS